jgi:hypothetical protein
VGAFRREVELQLPAELGGLDADDGVLGRIEFRPAPADGKGDVPLRGRRPVGQGLLTYEEEHGLQAMGASHHRAGGYASNQQPARIGGLDAARHGAVPPF